MIHPKQEIPWWKIILLMGLFLLFTVIANVGEFFFDKKDRLVDRFKVNRIKRDSWDERDDYIFEVPDES